VLYGDLSISTSIYLYMYVCVCVRFVVTVVLVSLCADRQRDDRIVKGKPPVTNFLIPFPH